MYSIVSTASQQMEGFPYLESKGSIQSYLESVAGGEGVGLDDLRLATTLDNRDKLASFRAKFCLPTIGEILEGQEIAEGVCKLCIDYSIYAWYCYVLGEKCK